MNWTKHIQVRYLLIKDRIGVRDLKVDHFPTGIIITDHFINPLQGEIFSKFRAQIQGIPDELLVRIRGFVKL